MAAKNITSPEDIFYQCTHRKKIISPLCEKAVPLCVYNIYFLCLIIIWRNSEKDFLWVLSITVGNFSGGQKINIPQMCMLQKTNKAQIGMETSREVASRVRFKFPKASFKLDFASSSRVEPWEKVWVWIGILSFIDIFLVEHCTYFLWQKQKNQRFNCFSNTFFLKRCVKKCIYCQFSYFWRAEVQVASQCELGKSLASLQVREFESSSFPSLCPNRSYFKLRQLRPEARGPVRGPQPTLQGLPPPLRLRLHRA